MTLQLSALPCGLLNKDQPPRTQDKSPGTAKEGEWNHRREENVFFHICRRNVCTVSTQVCGRDEAKGGELSTSLNNPFLPPVMEIINIDC